jgi:asparagine synthase (glutamine-hydrolysing)
VCGIAGTVAPALTGVNHVSEMTARQTHRGPDAAGVWGDGQCVLGHRRLAVIDLSGRGCQPMTDETQKLHLVFNGEIYNFRELRHELQLAGHRFMSDTDTEVILHGYRRWGTDLIPRLRGMFALALWDVERRRLFLARDRVGKKPLFYAHVGDRLVFASEIQGILGDPGVPRDVDWAAIDSYLSWGYVPAPATGFDAIRKLPPAHWMTVDVTGRTPQVRLERYWQLAYEPKSRLTLPAAAAELREVLTEAVRLRLLSDVPLGAFLSGGIDSSIVVGLMAELSSQPVKTFSIGFDEAAYSELPHARRVADLWATDHHEQVVRPDALGLLPELVRHYGEPYADSSAIPTYYVAQLARRHVTVALNGDGGDESFAGYERYRANAVAARLGGFPGSRAGATLASRLLPDSPDPKSRMRRARRFFEVANEPMAQRYARWVGYFSEVEKQALYRGPLRPLLAGERPLSWMQGLLDGTAALSPVDAAMSVDVRSYLPYDLLVKVDITSMAHSLEARSPLLDHHVMEFAAQLPVEYKLHRGQTKRLLLHAFPDLLPRENVNRRKMGFAIPVGTWFCGPLRELLQDTLLGADSRVATSLDRAALTALVRDHVTGRAENSAKLWSLLMLDLWHRHLVESPVPH